MWKVFSLFTYSMKDLKEILLLHRDWKRILLTPGRESCLLLVSYANRGINKKTCAICTGICGAAFWSELQAGLPKLELLALPAQVDSCGQTSSCCLLPPALFEVGREGWVLDTFSSMVPGSCEQRGNCVSSHVSCVLEKYGCLGAILGSPILPALALQSLHFPSLDLAMSAVQKIELYQPLF